MCDSRGKSLSTIGAQVPVKSNDLPVLEVVIDLSKRSVKSRKQGSIFLGHPHMNGVADSWREAVRGTKLRGIHGKNDPMSLGQETTISLESLQRPSCLPGS